MFNLINATIDFLLPRFCLFCEQKLSTKEKYLCNTCFCKLDLADNTFINDFYNEKFNNLSNIDFVFSCYKYIKSSPIQKIIHQLKYNGKFRIGFYLGTILGAKLKNNIEYSNFDLILPVPIHPIKKTERGYNQSYYIAKGVSKVTNIKIVNNVLIRKIYTKSQSLHNKKQRLENIKDIFDIKNGHIIKGKNIIILDDIITTGSTVKEIAKICKNNGAAKILAASIALTVIGN